MTKNHITIGLDMNDGSHINLKNTNLFFAERNLWFGAGFYVGYWCQFYRYVRKNISNRCAAKYTKLMMIFACRRFDGVYPAVYPSILLKLAAFPGRFFKHC